MSVTTFSTARGNIRVSLPADIAAGDTISGTVVSGPAGKDENEKEKNEAQLNGYVIESGEKRWPVSKGILDKLNVGLSTNSGLGLYLLDANGKPIGTVTLPVMQSASSTATNFNFPPIGQSGSAIPIIGPFDGDSANTRINIGGAAGQVIAESPRGAVMKVPASTVGQTNINVTDNGHNTTGSFRALRIDLTAPKTSLMKGESTEVHMEVQGLSGMTEPVHVQIQNHTPSNINMTGGNTQNVVIQPSQITTGGTFNWSTNITGTGTGGFNISATIPTTPSATPANTPTPATTRPTPTPGLPPPSVPAVSPAPSPSPAPSRSPQTSGPQVMPAGNDARFNSSYTKEDTDCCKKFLNQGAFEISDGKGNSFKIFRNKLTMVVDGKEYEWEFTQNGEPFYIEWMFCHLNDNMIISQLSHVMVQHVQGGNTDEKANTTSVSLHGPYRKGASSRASYGFLFSSQKVGTDTKGYSVSFSMDAEYCTWSCQLLAEDKTEEFRTPPPRSGSAIQNAIAANNGLPGGSAPYKQQAWWNAMYSYFFELQDCYLWYHYQDDESEEGKCNSAYNAWRIKLLNALGQMRQTATPGDKALIDSMLDLLKNQTPNEADFLRLQEKFDQLHLRYGTHVPPEIRRQIMK